MGSIILQKPFRHGLAGCGLGAGGDEWLSGWTTTLTSRASAARTSPTATNISQLRAGLDAMRATYNGSRPSGVTAAVWSAFRTAFANAVAAHNAVGGTGKTGEATTDSTGTAGRDPRYDASVATLQSQLQAAGFNPGTIDGIWGSRTSVALQRAVDSMGIGSATARFGQAAISRLGSTDPVLGGGGGGDTPSEEQGGLFAGAGRWLSGLLGGGTDLAAGTAAAAAEQAAGEVERRVAAGARVGTQSAITGVISNPLFLIGVAAAAVGIGLALIPKDKKYH